MMDHFDEDTRQVERKRKSLEDVKQILVDRTGQEVSV